MDEAEGSRQKFCVFHQLRNYKSHQLINTIEASLHKYTNLHCIIKLQKNCNSQQMQSMQEGLVHSGQHRDRHVANKIGPIPRCLCVDEKMKQVVACMHLFSLASFC